MVPFEIAPDVRPFTRKAVIQNLEVMNKLLNKCIHFRPATEEDGKHKVKI